MKLSAPEKVDGVAKEVFRTDDAPSHFGRIDAHVLDRSPDEVPHAPYEEIAEGDDLSANLARMRLFAHGVNGNGFAYRGDRQNSNSFASAALQAGELPPATGVAQDPAGRPGELLEFFAPGLNEPLTSSDWSTSRAGRGRAPLRSTNASENGDLLRQERSWHPLVGDPDSLNGRFGNWLSGPFGKLGDTRSPVLRALEEYRTSAAPDGPASISAQELPAAAAFRPPVTGGVAWQVRGGRRDHPCGDSVIAGAHGAKFCKPGICFRRGIGKCTRCAETYHVSGQFCFSQHPAA